MMTARRFEVFTQHSGDMVFSTRFRIVARIVTRYVRTLDYDRPIPYMPVEQNGLPDQRECPICGSLIGCSCAVPEDPEVAACIFCHTQALMLTDEFNPVCAAHADATYH